MTKKWSFNSKTSKRLEDKVWIGQIIFHFNIFGYIFYIERQDQNLDPIKTNESVRIGYWKQEFGHIETTGTDGPGRVKKTNQSLNTEMQCHVIVCVCVSVRNRSILVFTANDANGILSFALFPTIRPIPHTQMNKLDTAHTPFSNGYIEKWRKM